MGKQRTVVYKVSPRPNDPDQPFRQQLYLRALKTLNAQIVYGRYLSHVVKMYRAQPVRGESPFVEVVKTEEKGTGTFHKPARW